MVLAEALALVAVLVGAGAQAVTGIGFSLVCAPLLTVALGGGDGVRLANTLAIVVNLLLLRREWRGTDMRKAFALLLPAVIVAPVTAWAIDGASPRPLSIASGVLILVVVAALAGGVRIRSLVGWSGAIVAGATSGAMNVVVGVGGPAVVSYALNSGWRAQRLRPTLAAYFLGVNVVSVLARGVPSLTASFLTATTLTVLIGFALGTALAGRVDKARVQSATLVLPQSAAVSPSLTASFERTRRPGCESALGRRGR